MLILGLKGLKKELINTVENEFKRVFHEVKNLVALNAK